MNEILRNSGLRHLLGILLLALFTTKMCTPVSNLIANKFLSCLKVYTETDKTDKEEKKSAEKEINQSDAQYKNLALLSFYPLHKPYDHHHKIDYRLDNFGSVYTPPPNFAV